jgi:hypothetical protein
MHKRANILAIATMLIVPCMVWLVTQGVNHYPSGANNCAAMHEQFERQDLKSRVTSAPILVIGQDDVEAWIDAPDTLLGSPLLRRYAAGATLPAMAECYDRLIARYAPRHVFVVIDPRDILTTPRHIIESLQRLEAAKTYYENTELVFTIVLPPTTPSLLSSKALLQRFTEDLQQALSATPNTRSLSMEILLGATTDPYRDTLFWPNGRRWGAVVYDRFTGAIMKEVSTASPVAGKSPSAPE